MYLVFDTETTGLPKDWKAPMTDVDNWPRVIQLAFTAYNYEYKPFVKYKQLIKPDGWEVPSIDYYLRQGFSQAKAEKEATFWIKNGFTQQQNEEEGVPILNALNSFITVFQQCSYIIAHNMSYDNNVLGAEMIRNKVRPNNKPVKLCTKLASTEFCQIPDRFGGYKWPKLEELHNKLFGRGFEGAHDAGNDVDACAKCFFELIKLDVINLNSYQ